LKDEIKCGKLNQLKQLFWKSYHWVEVIKMNRRKLVVWELSGRGDFTAALSDKTL